MPVSAMLIASFSVMLTSAVVGNAFFQKKQFYPSVVYLTKSNVSLAVIYTQAFVLVMFVGKLMRRVFFGQLRTAEFEHLMERAWYAVTETCLAFTMFRDDLSPKFVALFTVLLFLKSFHWLVEDRIDFMERSPVISWLFHIRAISLLTLLTVLDLGFVEHACQYTLSQGASVQLVFGFEYAILLTAVAYVLVKYALHTLDARRDTPWEHKAVYLLYAELMINFLKVLLYLVFTAIMVKIHTLPLFAIRPMYSALRSFKKALSDVVLSRRAIHIMNTLYQDATPEQLAAGDNVCIICREEMTPESTAKRLPCGHMFHVLCLRSWFQRQQTCPTCRMDILRNAATPTAPAAEPPAPPANVGPAAAVNIQQLFNWPFPAAPPAAAAAAPGAPQTAPQPPLAAAFMPPPPFPMFMAPPIQTPSSMGVDLSGVSDDELRAMEGRERRAVEARIRHLREVQTLLDAAALLMQQYARVSPVSDDDGGSATVKSEPTASAAKSANQESPPEAKSPVTDERGAATAPVSPQEEIRQRRMRHFQAGGD